GGQILQRRSVRRRRLGAACRNQVQLGKMFPFVLRGDKLGAAIELIDNLENALFPTLGQRLRDEKPPDQQMGRGELILRDQRVGGFLHSIVNKLVGTRQTLDQIDSNRLPQSRVDPNL